MRYLVLSLILMACGAPRGGEYRQGIPVARPAPAFNPAWDAPHTTGQPGHVGPSTEAAPSPHKRVLPETPETRREAGLWAGDNTQASASPLAPVFVDGILLPYPPDAATLQDVYLIRMCASMMPHAMRGAGIYPVSTHLSPKERECIVAAYFRDCVNYVYDALKRSMPNTLDSMRKQLEFANGFHGVKCTPESRTPEVDAINVMRRTWDIRKANP